MKSIIDLMGGERCIVDPCEHARIASVLADHGRACVTRNDAPTASIEVSVESFAAAYRRIIRLRANSEVDWQCDLVRTCIELGLPERSASRPDLPLLGVRHALHQHHEGLLLWLDGVNDEERIQPLVDEWSELRREGGQFHLLVTTESTTPAAPDLHPFAANVHSLDCLAQRDDLKHWTVEDVISLQAAWPSISAATRVGAPAVHLFLERAVDLLNSIGACETAARLLDGFIAPPADDSTASQSLGVARLLERRGNIRLRQQRFLRARKDFRACHKLLTAANAAESEMGLRILLSIVETDLNECRLARAAARLMVARNLIAGIRVSDADLARYWMLRGAFDLQTGKAASAESLLARGIDKCGALHPEDALLRRIRVLRARAFFAQGKLRDAERELRHDIAAHSSAETAALETTASSLMLGDLLTAAGRFEEAQPLLQRVLMMRRHSLGRRHRLCGEVMSRLAVVLSHNGAWRDSQQLFGDSLDILQEVYGCQHPEVSRVLNDHAEALFTCGQYEESRQRLEQALAMQETSLRKSDPRIARTRNNLAAIHCARGQFERAEELYRRDLVVKREKLSRQHPAIADALNNLGNVCLSLGRWDEADGHLRAALEIRQLNWPGDHPAVAQSLGNLGYLRLQQRRYAESLTLLRESLRMREATLAPSHPHLAASCETIGEVLFRQGEVEAALPMFQRALEICEAAFGESHQRTAHVMAQLGRVELRLSKPARAELHLRRAGQMLIRTVGHRHRFRATALCGLAELDEQYGRHDDAREHWEEAYAMLMSAGLQLAASDVLFALGCNLMHESPAQAAESWSKCLQLRAHWLKEDHPEVAEAREALSTAGLALNETDSASAKNRLLSGQRALSASRDRQARSSHVLDEIL